MKISKVGDSIRGFLTQPGLDIEKFMQDIGGTKGLKLAILDSQAGHLKETKHSKN